MIFKVFAILLINSEPVTVFSMALILTEIRKNLLNSQMLVWSQEVPYDDVYENGISKTPREGLYDDYMNRMKQRFFGDEMGAPTRTLRRADDVNLDLAPLVNMYYIPNKEGK